ncbi:fimbrial protein [Pseudomonas sp. RC4D1]|uniref:fimbrial protein n=1 Tax=Pseudomonas sp. RC4D1 TaxID=2834407 RepID=UPI001BCD5D71|nr:fimbrial protein [Pseudomonas sp. RC4D1]MBS7560109.1 fimbrial protein [Pseudomonas sp. RC4D1]
MGWRYISVLLGSTLACNAVAYDLLLNVNGTIAANGCMVSAQSQNMLVDFHNVAIKQFYTNGTPFGKKKFVISLENCGADAKTVKVKFEGAPDLHNQELLALTGGDGVASGLAIEIMDKDSTTLTVNSFSTPFIIAKSPKIDFEFYAQYRSTGPVTVGMANAVVKFVMEYQ